MWTWPRGRHWMLKRMEDHRPPSSVAGSPSMLPLLTRGPEVCSLQEKGTKAPKGKERWWLLRPAGLPAGPGSSQAFLTPQIRTSHLEPRTHCRLYPELVLGIQVSKMQNSPSQGVRVLVRRERKSNDHIECQCYIPLGKGTIVCRR